MQTMVDSDDLVFYGLLAVGGYLAFQGFKKGLFEPGGVSKMGLANASTRAGAKVNTLSDRTFITIGDTTYGVRDSDLENTGFIKRRLALASILGNPEWAVKWAYS